MTAEHIERQHLSDQIEPVTQSGLPRLILHQCLSRFRIYSRNLLPLKHRKQEHRRYGDVSSTICCSPRVLCPRSSHRTDSAWEQASTAMSELKPFEKDATSPVPIHLQSRQSHDTPAHDRPNGCRGVVSSGRSPRDHHLRALDPLFWWPAWVIGFVIALLNAGEEKFLAQAEGEL